jgi:hypothetical protein
MSWLGAGGFGAGLIVGWALSRLRGRHRRRWSLRFDWDDDSSLDPPPRNP